MESLILLFLESERVLSYLRDASLAAVVVELERILREAFLALSELTL